MVQIASYKFIRGLDLNSNPLYGQMGRDVYGAGRSACQIADNCVLTRQRMIGNRRGFDYFTASTSALVDGLFEYQSYLVQHQADNTLWRGDSSSGTRTQYTGSFVPPSPYRMDATVGRGSLFFTSTAGPQKLDSITGTPTRSGLTKGLIRSVSPTGTGAGFMSGYSKAAYHVTYLYTDANNQQVRSDVSSRYIVTNNTRQTVSSLTSTGGTATCTTPAAHGFSTGDTILISGATQSAYNGSFTVTVTSSTTFTYAVSGSPTSPATGTITAEKQMNTSVQFVVPWDIPSGAYWEIWRTVTVDASNADPGDTCYLVSRTLNATAAGATATYTDTLDDATLSGYEALYTNATQEGALQGNARPPVCSALTTYKDYTLYANTALDHQLNEELLATLVAGDQVIVSTQDGAHIRYYTAAAATNVAALQFAAPSGGLSPSADIAQTVQELCYLISSDSGGYWYAEYTSGPNDDPGKFRIWARSPLTAGFYLTSNSTTPGNKFNPVLPTSGQIVVSSDDARKNRVFYSKFQEPDAVPVLNYIDVGRLDQAILRVVAVRDAMYVIKEDGIWYLSGLDAPFTLVELDSTCHCIAPATVVMLNNTIFMLANQGVVQVSLSGVSVISFDIEPAIQFGALLLSNLATVAHGVGHESERSYILWLPTVSGDTYATQAYVYHAFIQEWTRWTKPAAAGVALNTNYTLYISSGLENALLKQRKAGDYTDFSDEEISITVTSQSGNVVTATWSNTKFTPTAGLTLHQSGNIAKVTVATLVSGTTWNFTLDRSTTYTAGAATARLPIYAHVRLSPQNCGESGLLKSIYTAAFYLDSNTVTQVAIEAATNEAPLINSYPITAPISSGWGSDSWGDVSWGDNTSVRAVPFLVDLPLPDNTGEYVTAGWIHNVSQEQFVIAQAAFAFDVLTEDETTQ